MFRRVATAVGSMSLFCLGHGKKFLLDGLQLPFGVQNKGAWLRISSILKFHDSVRYPANSYWVEEAVISPKRGEGR